MFISNTERLQLRSDITGICKVVEELNATVIFLTAKVKALEGKKPAKKMTDAQRAKQREYAKRYKAKKQMEKRNATSVSTTGL